MTYMVPVGLQICVYTAGVFTSKLGISRGPSAGLMLGHRRRRWSNNEPVLGTGWTIVTILFVFISSSFKSLKLL